MDLDLTLGDYRGIIRKRWPVSVLVIVIVNVSVVVFTQLQRPVYMAEALLRYDADSMALAANVPTGALSPTEAKMQTLFKTVNMTPRLAKKLKRRRDKVPDSFRYQTMPPFVYIYAYASSGKRAAELANAVIEATTEGDVDLREVDVRRRIAELTDMHAKVDAELRALQDKRQGYLKQNETTGLSFSLAKELLDLEQERDDLMKDFAADHPDVQEIQQRIVTMRRRLASLPSDQAEVLRLTREIRVHDEDFRDISRELENRKAELRSKVSDLVIVARATPPKVPFSPNKRLNLMAGAVASLCLGLFFALVLEGRDISVTTIEQVERMFLAPVLGIVPQFGSQSLWQDFRASFLKRDRHSRETFRSFLVFLHPPKSPHIEAYHSLRVNIQSKVAKTGRMVLTVTSSGVAEGKTLTSVNFCLAASNSGAKTLLVAADIRRPSVHQVFGMPGGPGLFEVLRGTVPWRETIRGRDDVKIEAEDQRRLVAFPGMERFHVMTGGKGPTGEAMALFSSRRLPELIAELRAEFDIVVFDCPPSLLFVDAIAIGQHTDGVVMVYKSGKMPRQALRRARDLIAVSKAKVLGVVLNGAHITDIEPGYGFYGDYGHYTQTAETV